MLAAGELVAVMNRFPPMMEIGTPELAAPGDAGCRTDDFSAEKRTES